jgi:hypothetical protein
LISSSFKFKFNLNYLNLEKEKKKSEDLTNVSNVVVLGHVGVLLRRPSERPRPILERFVCLEAAEDPLATLDEPRWLWSAI